MNVVSFDNREPLPRRSRPISAGSTASAAASLPDLLRLLDDRRRHSHQGRAPNLLNQSKVTPLERHSYTTGKTASEAAARFNRILNTPSAIKSCIPTREKKFKKPKPEASAFASSPRKRGRGRVHPFDGYHYSERLQTDDAVSPSRKAPEERLGGRKKRSNEDLYQGDLPETITCNPNPPTKMRSISSELEGLSLNNKLGAKSLTIAHCMGLQVDRNSSLVGSQLSVANQQRSAKNEYHRSKANAQWRL